MVYGRVDFFSINDNRYGPFGAVWIGVVRVVATIPDKYPSYRSAAGPRVYAADNRLLPGCQNLYLTGACSVLAEMDRGDPTGYDGTR